MDNNTENNNTTINKCIICLADFLNERINYKYSYRRTELKCGHFYHRKCIKHWLAAQPRENKACPYCRLKDPLSERERMKRWDLDFIIQAHPDIEEMIKREFPRVSLYEHLEW